MSHFNSRRERDDSLLLKGEELAGRYELTSRIGSGGFATIYSAHDLNMGVNVAIKVLKEKWSANEEFRRRFLQESRHHATLKHARIVPVTDRGVTPEGRLYYVMDLLEGTSLDTFLGENPGPRGWDEVVPIIVQLCEGLDYAHRKRVIHRDIKPANIFLEDRVDLSVKILDLGIAKELPSETGTGEHQTPLTDVNRGAPGTPEYMAPEQASSETSALDGRTDIYAIGVVMYLMLTGSLPFRAPPGLRGINRHITLLRMHQSEAVERMSLRAPEAKVPSVIEGIVMQALAKQPEDRFDSARDLRDSLLFAERRLVESGRLTASSGHKRERRLVRLASGFSSLTTAASVFLLLSLVKIPGVQCAAEALVRPRKPAPFAAPNPAAPNPVAPEPIAPEPVAPNPVAPEPVTPEPVAPEPLAPELLAPELLAPEPVAPEPLAPEPVVDHDPPPKPVTPVDGTSKKKPEADPAKMFKSLASRRRSKAEKKCADKMFPSSWKIEISVDKSSKTLKVKYLGTKHLSQTAKCALTELRSVSVPKQIRAGAPLRTTVTLKA